MILKKLYTIPIFLILALGLMHVVMYQNVSASRGEIVSGTIEINSTSPNGPVLNNIDNFGYSIANIGDVNDDGILDIAVGAYNDATSGYSTGTVHVMFMNNNGTVSDTMEINNDTLNGPVLRSADYFGSSIANIGDMNNDGTPDIAVGAIGYDTTVNSNGAIHVMLMNSNGTVSNTVTINDDTLNGPVLNSADEFGISIANIGDLNGDGTPDIAVGTHRANTGGTDRGAIHVMFMNSNGSIHHTVEINSASPNGPVLNDLDHFGHSIANIGDLNNDGTSDIAVGAHHDGTGGTDRGAIHVMFMNSNGSIHHTVEINSTSPNGPILDDGDNFGISIANIGDLNNDGTSDIAVGALFDDAGDVDSGAIHVMLLNRNGTVSRTIEINSTSPNGPVLDDGDNFGISIANIGDLNNDGTSDIAVGALFDDTGGTDRGAIHVLFMNSIDTTPPTIINITSNATTFDTLKVDDTISFTLGIGSAEDDAIITATYNSVALSWNSIDDGTTYTSTYTVSEGDADHTTPLQITNVTITDSAGNTSLPFEGTDILDTIDANSPKFSSAQTLSISQIAITLDQNVTISSAIPNDFTLGGLTGGPIISITSVSNNIITLDIAGATISDSDDDDDVTISYARTSGSFDDVSGNLLLDFAENVTNNLDFTPPVITLNGDNPLIIELGEGYTELGATTSDGSQVTINSAEFIDAIGTYSIYYDSVDASGNKSIRVVRTVNVVEATIPTSCIVPFSGDWTITTSCTIDTSATVQGNVIVQNNSILSIPFGITLGIDFVAFNLTVQSGSGVLIKSGGTIT